MNKCHFLGRFVEPPELEPVNNTSVARFYLEVEEYRKDKNGSKQKRKDILDFEAWDTAATAIAKQAKVDDFIAVECVARKYYDDVVFRVMNFKIFNNIANIE